MSFMSFMSAFSTDYGVLIGNYVFKRFNHYTTVAAETQEATLQKIMKKNKNCELGKKYDFANIHSIRDFQDKVPLSTFEDYLPLIDRMIDNDEKNIITSSKVIRYTASSGSIGKPKIQPKTAKDLVNMQGMGFAATPACASKWFKERGMYKKLPAQMGPLLINLNGHPLKNGMQSNGAGQVPFTYLTPILKYFVTTPLEILYPEDQNNTNTSYFQCRFALVNRDVTYLGSMVITLLTTMFEYMEGNWELLCNDIEKGTIDPSIACPDKLRAQMMKKIKPDPQRAAELRREFEKGFDTEVAIARRIWPKLCWGYGMIGSTLAAYVEKLRRYVGDLPMHNMGYAASEGFMAMPVELNATDYVLLPRSLVYEFLPVDAPEGTRPLLLNEIEVGKDYEIIVTNFSGLYRYRILDIVHVTGMHNNSPKIEFLYRSNMGLNLANEKTTTQMLDWVAEKVEEKFGIDFKGYSFYSDAKSEKPHYVMLGECPEDLADRKAEIEKAIDELFSECNEKYEKYRMWGMIHEPVFMQLADHAYDDYKESLKAQGRVINQVKPVVVINTQEREDFFFSRVKK